MIKKGHDTEFTKIDESSRRALLSYDDELMTVKIVFDKKTSDVKLHSHPHRQTTYVLKGQFEFHIEDEVYFLEQGDSILFERNVPHGCIALEKDSELLDTFSPMRKDFL